MSKEKTDMQKHHTHTLTYSLHINIPRLWKEHITANNTFAFNDIMVSFYQEQFLLQGKTSQNNSDQNTSDSTEKKHNKCWKIIQYTK